MPLWPSPASDITWASALFALALAVVATFVGQTVRKLHRPGDASAELKRAVLLVLLVVVPLLWDPRTLDAFNLPKFTATLVGAMAIVAVWVVELVRREPPPRWRTGLNWPVLGLLGWTAISTAASVSPRMSVLGSMYSHDGLLAASAFTVIFFAVAQAVKIDDVKAILAVLYFGAGGLSALYGLIQLHDRVLDGTQWDWIHFFEGGGTESFAEGGIFTTFGNPNYVAGFLAMLVPIGLALFRLHKSWPVRALILAITTALVLALIQTASRGAQLATLVGVGLAASLELWPKMERHSKIWFPGAGAVVAGAAIVVLAFGSGYGARLSSDLRSDSTVSMRLSFWEAGVGMANDRPLVGQGPDMFPERLSRYQDAETAKLYGVRAQSDGSHNLFIGQLANTGYPGLVLLLAVLVLSGVRAIRALGRLAHVESHGEGADARRARDGRVCLVGVVSGLAAYLVQACFNVSQIGLSLIFWVLLGLLCAISLGAGVPSSLRPRRLLDRPVEPSLFLPDLDGRAPVGRPPAPGGTQDEDVVGGAIAVLTCIGLAVSVSAATRPLRADRNAWAARSDLAAFAEARPNEAAGLSRRATTRLTNAVKLNPWDPSYLAARADAFFTSASSLASRSPAQATALRRARLDYERALDLRPYNGYLLERYASVLLTVDQLQPGDGTPRSDAIDAMRRAVSAHPHSDELRANLELLLAGSTSHRTLPG